jgi:hypothetical protein
MSRRAWILLTLLLVTLVAWAPLLAVLVASSAASAFDCRLDEGSTHPCLVAGADIGPALYVLGVSGWLMLAAFPLMLLTLVAWVGVVIWAIVRRLRRQKVVG